MKNNIKRHSIALTCATLIAWLGAPLVVAQQSTSGPRLVTPSSVLEARIPLFQSKVVALDAPAARVSVANPDVADLVIISPTEFYVLAKDIGVTNVLVWDRGSRVSSTISVEVTHDLEGLKAKLAALMPSNRIEVRSAQRSIVLSGSVPDANTMNAAVRVAESYLAQIQTAKKAEAFEQESGSRREDKSVGQVINLLEIGGAQQVMLEVKVAEIARSELKRLDARFNALGRDGKWSFGGVNGGARFPDARFGTDGLRSPVFANPSAAPYGPVIDEFAPNDLTIQNQGLFASFLSDSFVFNAAIDAAKEKGLAKILAEPTLTTLTGQEAKFLSGGEFPIPVPRGNDGVAIEFKEFGVGLRMLPVVLSSGQINVKLDISVSELQSGNSVLIDPSRANATFVIPSLSKRSASGTVELADGQTIGLAGLINEDVRSLVTKFPGLGSMPILGALFRSKEFIKGETELVILVTPRLAKPVDPKRVPLPTQNYREPSDWDFYMMGRQEAPAPTAK
jgi:pilus assembly protein CpaC